MGDRLVQTFWSVGLFLQVPLAGNCKLATLLQKRKLCTKRRLHCLYCGVKVSSYVGIKTGSKNKSKARSEIVSKVWSTPRSKNSVLAFLKCMDQSLLAFLNCMDGSELAHLRLSIQSASTIFPESMYLSYYARKAPGCPFWHKMIRLGKGA